MSPSNDATCVRATAEEWRVFLARFPEATPGELVQRAIEEDAPGLVLATLHATGVDVNAPCEPDVYESPSPLRVALEANNLRMTDLLLRRGALDLSRSLPEHGRWSWAQRVSVEVLRRFLEHPQAEVDEQDGDGCTLVHEVVGDVDDLEKLRLLLRLGCRFDIERTDSTTALYRAALAGHVAAVDLLLEHGADANARNNDNRWSVLHVAVANADLEIADRLLAQPALEVNAEDDLGNTALHLACERGLERLSARLLGHPRIEVNRKNRAGWTALHAAAFGGHGSVVEQLLARPDLRINLVDRDRQTALHWAVQNGLGEIVELLAGRSDSNLHITNRVAGHHALDTARALGLTEVADRLEAQMEARPLPDELDPEDDYEPPQPPPPEVIEPFVPEDLAEFPEPEEGDGR